MGDKAVKFSLLPPDLKLKLGPLALDANVKKVSLVKTLADDLELFPLQLGLRYNYGQRLELFLEQGRSSVSIGVNPATGNSAITATYHRFGAKTEVDIQNRSLELDLSYAYKGLPLAASTRFQNTSAGLITDIGFNVGVRPQPFMYSPSLVGPIFASTVQAGGDDAAYSLAYGKIRADELSVIGRTAAAISKIADDDSPTHWGAGAYVSVDPYNRLSIFFVGVYRFGDSKPSREIKNTVDSVLPPLP